MGSVLLLLLGSHLCDMLMALMTQTRHTSTLVNGLMDVRIHLRSLFQWSSNLANISIEADHRTSIGFENINKHS
jgi:hypothetical protein